jgi:hypothetical protein
MKEGLKMNLPESKLTYNQKKSFKKFITIDGKSAAIVAEVRYDDECKNGHNTFSITGNIYESYRRPGESTITNPEGKTLYCSAGGCIHDEISKHFPELRHLIKWHLVSSDGPMHYLANTLYLAGDKDYNGKRKGEPISYDKRLYFENFPIQQKISSKLIAFIETNPDFNQCVITEIKHKDSETYKPKYTIIPETKEWHECEFDTQQEAEEMLLALKTIPYTIVKVPTSFSKGKEQELEAARSTAVAPNASLEQLQSEEWLLERLPNLMEEFKQDMEKLGFEY